MRARGGKAFWRGLEEVAQGEAFAAFLQHEFPRELMAGTFSTNRRTFLKLMGAALVMAGVTSCNFNDPADPIVPYVTQPEEIVQGMPLFFASAMPFRGYGLGVLVENHMGRPTKVEGNPQHPASLVIAGEEQPPIVHALAHAMNAHLGNIGQTVTFTEPIEVEPVDSLQSLRTLTEAMAAGQVDTLLIIDANPVYTAPVELDFGTHLAKVAFAIHNSLHYDETAARCQWHIPQTHYLEAWSDVRAYDGTATIIQPLIAPLFNSRTAHEMVAALLGQQPLRSAAHLDLGQRRVDQPGAGRAVGVDDRADGRVTF